MGDQTQAYDIFQTPLSSGYPLPLMSEIDNMYSALSCERFLITINYLAEKEGLHCKTVIIIANFFYSVDVSFMYE